MNLSDSEEILESFNILDMQHSGENKSVRSEMQYYNKKKRKRETGERNKNYKDIRIWGKMEVREMMGQEKESER